MRSFFSLFVRKKTARDRFNQDTLLENRQLRKNEELLLAKINGLEKQLKYHRGLQQHQAYILKKKFMQAYKNRIAELDQLYQERVNSVK